MQLRMIICCIIETTATASSLAALLWATTPPRIPPRCHRQLLHSTARVQQTIRRQEGQRQTCFSLMPISRRTSGGTSVDGGLTGGVHSGSGTSSNSVSSTFPAGYPSRRNLRPRWGHPDPHFPLCPQDNSLPSYYLSHQRNAWKGSSSGKVCYPMRPSTSKSLYKL